MVAVKRAVAQPSSIHFQVELCEGVSYMKWPSAETQGYWKFFMICSNTFFHKHRKLRSLFAYWTRFSHRLFSTTYKLFHCLSR